MFKQMLTKRILNDIETEIIPEFKSKILELAGKTILITGGNSLLASYLVDSIIFCNKFLENKIKLIIINKNPISEKSRLSHLINDDDDIRVATDFEVKSYQKANL